jgi:flagellar FliJ protein
LGKDINALRNAEGRVDNRSATRRLEACVRGAATVRRGSAGASGEHESMKSRETLIRLKKFQVDERRRRVAQIESMISEFERISSDLERDIKIEQDRSGIHDPGHFAYPTYAKAAIQRRDNLKRSANELKTQLEDAKAALTEAFEEMKKAEMLDERDQMRERAEEDDVAQAESEAMDLMRSSARA